MDVVDGMNEEEQFCDLLDKMQQIHNSKRHDYADDEDRFSNLALSEMMGIPAWKGCAVRISDKFSRLAEFAKKETLEVKDENIEDTLIDLANYALICIILYRRAICRPENIPKSIERHYTTMGESISERDKGTPFRR